MCEPYEFPYSHKTTKSTKNFTHENIALYSSTFKCTDYSGTSDKDTLKRTNLSIKDDLVPLYEPPKEEQHLMLCANKAHMI